MNVSINKEAAKAECATWGKKVEDIFDNKLMYFTAHKENVDRFFTIAVQKYLGAFELINEVTRNKTLALYIFNRLFGSGGRVGDYLDKGLIPKLSLEETAFLNFMRQNPCQFCLVALKKDLGDDFFLFENIFNSKEYVIYSKGIAATLQDFNPVSWLLNLTFNGHCYQTMGPIVGTNLDSDDLFTFAVHCDTNIVTEDDLIESLQRNPFPFQMLAAFPKLPRNMGKNQEVFYLYGEYETVFNPEELKNEFYVSQKGKNYRLTPKGEFAFHPHFAVAWYDSISNILQVEATSEVGYSAIMNQLKYIIDDEDLNYQLKAHFGIFMIIKSTMFKNVNLVPYISWFDNIPIGNESEAHLYVKKFDPNDYPGVNFDFLKALGIDLDNLDDKAFDDVDDFDLDEDDDFDEDTDFDEEDDDEEYLDDEEDQASMDRIISIFEMMHKQLEREGSIDNNKVAKEFNVDLEYVEILKETFLKIRAKQK